MLDVSPPAVARPSSYGQLPFPSAPPPAATAPEPLLAGRYRLGECYHARGTVERFLATDLGTEPPTPVRLLRELAGSPGGGGEPAWPGLDWEAWLRGRTPHPGLPRVLDRFAAGGFDHLVLDDPAGVSLWDAWDDPNQGAAERYGWLARLADMLHLLHRSGACLETFGPEDVRITPAGQPVLPDAGTLLPLPPTSRAALRPGPTTPAELLEPAASADARAGLFSFGALLLALELGRELTDLDLLGPGTPRPFLERCPDAHPLLGRLLAKTCCRERGLRFPTEDAWNDPTGFEELIRTLELCRRELGRARLEVAAWTSTGMVRTGNEDAFALVHAAEAGRDDLEEYALVVLADGMGGSEAGEVAAALAVQSLRHSLMTQPPFTTLVEGPDLPGMADPELIAGRLWNALHEANRHVYLAGRQGAGRRGMGCTAEAVYLDGRTLLVGHVGDSRTYHLHRGTLTQVTRDHTFVARLVAAGQITPAEAETHPRRAELQQAIGGRGEIDPELYRTALAPGDWVLVCSDGLSGELRPAEIQEILERAPSADAAARRLVNRANAGGAHDNVTAVVVRLA
jgi:serine/threonine protein phosphatase PrpC